MSTLDIIHVIDMIKAAMDRRGEHACGFAVDVAADGPPPLHGLRLVCTKAPHVLEVDHAVMDADGVELAHWAHPAGGSYIFNAFGKV